MIAVRRFMWLLLAVPAWASFVWGAPVASAAGPEAKPMTAAAAPGAPAAAPAAAKSPDGCVTCHMEVGGAQVDAYKKDIHYQKGVGCSGCHGGDPKSDDQDAAMSRARGYIGIPKKADIPAVCGKCHGPSHGGASGFHLKDTRTDYDASAHAKALSGSDAGPQCVSCHGSHGITPASDPRSPVHPQHVAKTCGTCHGDAAYMRNFAPGLPVDQYEKYLTSEHGKRNAAGDPNPATCVSCHSNHKILGVKDPRSPVYPTQVPATCGHCHADSRYMAKYHIPTTQYEDYKASVHGEALLKKSDLNAPACNSCHGNHGAAPPGIASVAAACGSCHQSNAELFGKSAHRPAFEKEKLPACVTCHSNHGVKAPTNAMVSMDKPAPCAKCHRNDGSDKAAPTILRMRLALDSLSLGGIIAQRELAHAESLGMDVSDARYSLKDVNQSVVQSRVAIHSFKLAQVLEAARPGIRATVQAGQAGRDAAHEYRFRREGLVVSTLIVTLLVILLYLKIRQIERSQRDEKK